MTEQLQLNSWGVEGGLTLGLVRSAVDWVEQFQAVLEGWVSQIPGQRQGVRSGDQTL